MLGDSEGVGRRSCWEILREWEGGLAGRFRGSGREVFLEGSEGVGGRSFWKVLREWEGGLAAATLKAAYKGTADD